MRVMTPHSIPVFLGDATIGPPKKVYYPAIKTFDAFYKTPIIVGFHILGSPDECPCSGQIPEFIVQLQETENYPDIVGLYSYAVADELPEVVMYPQQVVPAEMQDVIAFYGYEYNPVPNESNEVELMFEDQDTSPLVIGFYAYLC